MSPEIIEALNDIAIEDEQGRKCWCLHGTLFRRHSPGCTTLKLLLEVDPPAPAQDLVQPSLPSPPPPEQ